MLLYWSLLSIPRRRGQKKIKSATTITVNAKQSWQNSKNNQNTPSNQNGGTLTRQEYGRGGQMHGDFPSSKWWDKFWNCEPEYKQPGGKGNDRSTTRNKFKKILRFRIWLKTWRYSYFSKRRKWWLGQWRVTRWQWTRRTWWPWKSCTCGIESWGTNASASHGYATPLWTIRRKRRTRQHIYMFIHTRIYTYINIYVYICIYNIKI